MHMLHINLDLPTPSVLSIKTTILVLGWPSQFISLSASFRLYSVECLERLR